MSLSLLFYIAAFIAVGSAIFVVLNKNAVYSAILLVVCFFSLAMIYLLLEAYFLAVLEIFIYAGAIIDRKSTRLNSSHALISYAVFCLKKKTNHSH